MQLSLPLSSIFLVLLGTHCITNLANVYEIKTYRSLATLSNIMFKSQDQEYSTSTQPKRSKEKEIKLPAPTR